MSQRTSPVNPEPPLLRLAAGSLRLEASPRFGGRILRFWSEGPRRVQWLHPITHQAAAIGEHVRGGCFPLVPFSNRIRNARLRSGEDQIELAPDPLGMPHAMHGPGWRSAWTLLQRSENVLRMRLAHRADPRWPFDFDAEQTIRLHPDRLELRLRLRSPGLHPMPAGLGWHPYFPWRGGMRVELRAGREWPLAADLMPSASIRCGDSATAFQPALDPRTAMVRALSGWNGQALLMWPKNGCALQMQASRSLGHLILFTPGDAPFACVEPASHAIDGFNLAARGLRGTGTRLLAPGAEMRASMVLRPVSAYP